MTANHAHTPSTEHVRFIYSLDGADREHKAQEFDRWHAAEIAAAEQRGAERGWDEGQKSGLRYAERALAAQKIGRPDLPGPPTTNPYRADQMEADNA